MMSFRIQYVTALLILGTLFFSGEKAQANENSAWRTFRNGPRNQGVSSIAVKSLVTEIPRETPKDTLRDIREFSTGGLIWATPVIDHEDNVFFGAANKNFYRIDKFGNQIWMYTLFDRPDSLIDSAAALLTHDGKKLTIVPGGDGFLHTLDQETGELQWFFRSDGATDADHDSGKVVNSFEGNVQIGPNGMIYAGSDNGYIYAIDPNGVVENHQMMKELWRFRTGNKHAKKPKDMVWSSPVFGSTHETHWMAFGGLDGNIYLLDPLSGNELSRYGAGGTVKSSPAVDEDRNIYFGTANGKLISLRVDKKGQGLQLNRRWEFDTHGEIYSSPAVKGNRIVFGSLDGYLYCLDSQGKLSWKFGTYSQFGISRNVFVTIFMWMIWLELILMAFAI